LENEKMLKNGLKELEDDNKILANNCQDMKIRLNMLNSNFNMLEKEKERHLEHNAVEKQKMKVQMENFIYNKDDEKKRINYLTDENNRLKSQIECLRNKYENEKAEMQKVIAC
jgi:hypothetical protein